MRTKLNKLAFRRLAVAMLVACTSAAQADQSAQAQQLLSRISEAGRTTSYEGTFIYRHQGNLETLRVVHQASPDGVRERLYALTGAPREIVRDDEKVSCYLPDDKQVVTDLRQFENPLDDAVPKDVGELLPHYRLEVGGGGRVAGRDTTQIGVWPQDEYRYGYRFWIDEATGLLLRSDLMGEEGEPIEQLMFTELKAPVEIADEALQPSFSGQDFTWYRSSQNEAMGASATDAAPSPAWEVTALPPGFQLAVHEIRRLPGSDGPVEHLLFSDGLTNVSVYVEKTDPVESFSGLSRMGAVNAYGRRLDDHQITVVGEVPRLTVKSIADSVRYVGGQ